MHLVDISSRSIAQAYILETFGDVSGLASYILRTADNQLQLSALVPVGTTLDRALNFRHGGLCKSSEAQNWLFRRLEKMKKDHPYGTFLVQDIWNGSVDHLTLLEQSQHQTFRFDADTYFWLDRDKFNSSQLKIALQSTLSLQRIAAFSESKFDAALVKSDFTVDKVIYDNLVSKIREFYLSAYDDESFLMVRVPKGLI
jgi:hypothetical protein